jgi:hypothetical protein
MKVLKVFAVIVLMVAVSYGQVFNDGKKFELGYTFRNTDSTRLQDKSTTISAVDTLTAGRTDTLYTAALDMSPDRIFGMWTVRAIIDSVAGDAASDSLKLAIRFATRFDNTKVQWGPWHNIWSSMKTDSLYEKIISPTDSSWFMNANSRQYRLTKTDSMKTGDTLSTPYITDFLH